MRLGFYYHIPAIEKEGKILLPGYLGRFLDNLADHCEKLVLFQHLPNANENSNFDYAMKSTNIRLISLPPRGSVPHRFFHARKYTRIIRDYRLELDAILLRGPSPLVALIAQSLKPLKTILMIIGDQLAGIDSLPQPRWRKELIRIWSWYNAKRQLQVARSSLVFVNSRVLYRQFEGKLKNLHETRTTTLNASDLYQRPDTCLSRPIRLLYTGRMDPAKGLMDMVAAISILVEQGADVVLDLVGWPEKESNILDEIKHNAHERRVADRVFYHGYKPVGPELFAFYKKADIYLLASQASEGFPRTIWEAMAHSLPVVATRVGSIPDFISGVAQLVEPKNPQAFAEGISKIMHNTSLRQDYISKGYILASRNTLEVQVGEMARVMKEWVNTNA